MKQNLKLEIHTEHPQWQVVWLTFVIPLYVQLDRKKLRELQIGINVQYFK
jgi:hypothetical protein